MKILTWLSLLVSLTIASCRTGSHQAPVSLTAASLYDIDSVRAAIAGDPQMSAADLRKLAQATKAYKTQPSAAAVDSLKSLLFTTPSPQVYYELGSALLVDKQYAEAEQALGIAEQLRYIPLTSVFYKLAAAYANDPGNTFHTDSLSFHYMGLAIQMGYPNPRKFLIDPAFSRVSDNWLFKNAYKEAMAGRQDETVAAWQEFTGNFPDLSLPLTIDSNWIHNHPFSEMQNIHSEFETYVPEMRTAAFSRDESDEYFYVGKLKRDSAYTVLVYAGSNLWEDTVQRAPVDSGGMEESPFGPIYFYLTTYTHQGKIIDKIQVAGQLDYTKLFKIFAVTPDLTFTVTDQELVYAKDPVKYGYVGNPVAGVNQKAIHQYRINAQGKFEPVQPQALSMR